MSKSLAEIRAYSLSDKDINDILDPDTKVFPYPKFAEMEHIDQAFDKLGRCVFLFLTENENTGHWLCMFKRKGFIEYFDSFGERPDAQRSWVSQEQLVALGEDRPYLMDLLKKSGYHVYYNTHPYQKDKSDFNTCGRWCVARLICKDMTNQQFYNIATKSGHSPDDWVSQFTYEMLGK